jgi:hypothetical protein
MNEDQIKTLLNHVWNAQGSVRDMGNETTRIRGVLQSIDLSLTHIAAAASIFALMATIATVVALVFLYRA